MPPSCQGGGRCLRLPGISISLLCTHLAWGFSCQLPPPPQATHRTPAASHGPHNCPASLPQPLCTPRLTPCCFLPRGTQAASPPQTFPYPPRSHEPLCILQPPALPVGEAWEGGSSQTFPGLRHFAPTALPCPCSEGCLTGWWSRGLPRYKAPFGSQPGGHRVQVRASRAWSPSNI